MVGRNSIFGRPVKSDLKEQVVMMWTGFFWLTARFTDGLL
jgi:hypothetical protein